MKRSCEDRRKQVGLTLDDLDGKYKIRSETSDGGPYRINGDGVTEIKGGRTSRTDENGYIWNSVFSIAGKDKVLLQSTLDPGQSHEDNFIKDNKNNLTREKVTYSGELLVRRIGGSITLEGEIEHGIVKTRLVMTRVG